VQIISEHRRGFLAILRIGAIKTRGIRAAKRVKDLIIKGDFRALLGDQSPNARLFSLRCGIRPTTLS
jgi:hypothetical protein